MSVKMEPHVDQATLAKYYFDVEHRDGNPYLSYPPKCAACGETANKPTQIKQSTYPNRIGSYFWSCPNYQTCQGPSCGQIRMFFMVPPAVLQERGLLSPATVRALSPHADQNHRNYHSGPSSPYIPVMKRKDKMQQEAPEDQSRPDQPLPNQDDKDQTRSHTFTPEFQTFQHSFESMTGLDYSFQALLQHSQMTTILIANGTPEMIESYNAVHARLCGAYHGYLERRTPRQKSRGKRARPYPPTNPTRSTHKSAPSVTVSDHEEGSSQPWREVSHETTPEADDA